MQVNRRFGPLSRPNLGAKEPLSAPMSPWVMSDGPIRRGRSADNFHHEAEPCIFRSWTVKRHNTESTLSRCGDVAFWLGRILTPDKLSSISEDAIDNPKYLFLLVFNAAHFSTFFERAIQKKLYRPSVSKGLLPAMSLD